MATMVHTPSSSSSTSHHHSAHCGCTSSNGGHHSAGHGQTYSYSASDFDLLKALTSTSGASRQASSSNSNSNNNGFAARRALLAQQQQQKASLRRPQLDPLILETAAHSGPHVTRNHFLHEFYPHPEDPSSAFSWHADYRRPGYGTSRRPAYADCDVGPDEEPKQQQQTSSAAASSSSSAASMKKQQQAISFSPSSSAGPSALNDPKSATQQPRAVESAESSINVSKTTPAQSAAVDGQREEIDENPQGPSIYRSRQAPRKVRLERERKEQGQAVINTDDATVADSGLVRAEQADTSIHTNLKDIDPAQKLEHDLLPSTAPASAASLQDSIFHPDPVELPKILKVSEPSFFHTFTQAAAQSTASALGIAATNTPAAAPTGPPLQVVCFARTRVPTPHGEVFLHLYKNNWDDKEHLAFVFDRDQLDDTSSNPNANAPGETAPSSASLPESSEAYGTLRSKSLDAVWREGETDIERIVRGAYVGRLSSTTAKVSRARDAPTSSPGGSHTHMHVAPKLSPDEPVLIRIHSECFTGETIGSQRCDCGEQLDEAFRLIHTSPSGLGIIIYLRQEGRGIGLLEKIKAYNLQDLGHDTVTANLLLGHSADLRNYALAGEMLRDLGVDKNVRLLTNNPDKIDSIEKEGIKVAERVPMVPRGWSVQIPKILLQRKKKSKSKKPFSGERPKILKKRRPALQTKASTASIQSTVQTPPLLSPSAPIFEGGHPRKARNKTIEALRSSTAGGGPYDSDGIRSVEASASEAETEDYDDDAADSYGVRSITGSLEDDEQRAAGQSHEEGEDEEQDEEEDDDDDSDTDDSAEREEALEDYLISMNRTGVGMIGAGLTQSKELEKYLKTKIERMGHMLVAPATPPSTPLPLRRNARSKKEKAQGGHGHLHAHGHSRLSHSHHTLPPSHIASNMQDSIASFKTDEEGIACDAGPDCEDCRRQKLQEGYFDQDDAYGEDMFG